MICNLIAHISYRPYLELPQLVVGIDLDKVVRP